MKFISLIGSALLLAILPRPAMGGAMAQIGKHPTSSLTNYPELHSLQAYAGRIYMSYGDWDNFPAVVIVSYDPVANQFRLEHSPGSDSIGYFRVLDGKLYAPHCDPIHFEDFHDFSCLDASLPEPGWREQTPTGYVHDFDCTALNGTLYFAGDQLTKSTDGGVSWSALSVGSSNWCFTHRGRVYFQNGSFDGTTVTSNGIFAAYQYLYRPVNIGPGSTGTTEYTVALSSRTAGIAEFSTPNLVRFNGSTVTTPFTGASDFVTDGKKVYVLTLGSIRVCADATVASPTFTMASIGSVPSNGRSMEILNGVIYVGTSTGFLYAANLDGTPLSVSPPATVNLLPESFGRGLAADGNHLLVGAPDALSTVPLAGRVEVFEHAFGTAWTSTASLLPPTPKLSGWFGKDVALSGSTMAVVETGYDTSKSSRGSSARVHVYQHTNADGWISRAIMVVPFAHTVAIEGGFLFVGTANYSDDQAPGQPGVTPYLLTYNETGDLVVTAQTQLMPVVNGWGYKPVARVAAKGDLLVAGFAGDISRGAAGMISVFQKNADGLSFQSAPVQEISIAASEWFGEAVSFDGSWLAVGAPRSNDAASRAGVVYLYERTGDPAAPFLQRQKIISPLAQPEADFGAAVAVRHGVLLVGSPGAMSGSVRHAGKVYRYALADGTWVADGEVPAPAASVAEYGIEVAIGDTYLAAGSRLGTTAATLEERVALQANPRPFTGLDLWAEQGGFGAVAPLDDGEGDRLPQILEYVFHLNPALDDSTVEATASPVVQGQPTLRAVDGGGYEFRYVVPAGDARLTAQPEQSGDLVTWTPVAAAPTVVASVGGWELRAVTVPAGSTQMFARLKVLYDRP